MNDRLKIGECFYFFKNIIKKGGKPIMLSNQSKVGSENNNFSNMENAKGANGQN